MHRTDGRPARGRMTDAPQSTHGGSGGRSAWAVARAARSVVVAFFPLGDFRYRVIDSRWVFRRCFGRQSAQRTGMRPPVFGRMKSREQFMHASHCSTSSGLFSISFGGRLGPRLAACARASACFRRQSAQRWVGLPDPE